MNYKKLILIIIIFLTAVLLGYYCYSSYFARKGEIVILYPDQGIRKKKPKDPGGIVIPHAKSLVYEKLKANNNINKKVRILPEPEKPISIQFEPIVKNAEFNSIDEILANIEFYEHQVLKEDTQELEDVANNVIMPNLLTEIPENDTDPDFFVPGINLNIRKAPGGGHKLDYFNFSKNKDGYKIQLSATGNEQEAHDEWQRIKSKHFKILKNANLIIKKVKKKNNHIFFLVMTGPYSSLNKAKLVCKKLIDRRQNCIIVKPDKFY